MSKNGKALLLLTALTTSGMVWAAKGPDDVGELHATVNVKAKVINACEMDKSTTIDAGSYSATDAAAKITTGSLGFKCNKGTEYEFYFNKGAVSDTSVTGTMGTLAYTLDITGPGINDLAVPGDPASNEGLSTGAGQLVALKLTIPAGQFSVPSGSYTDAVDLEMDY